MNGRLASLDALRGFDMLWIMGGGALAIAVSQTLGFAEGTFVYDQMHHAAWHGLRFMDTIFPLFLFIAGVSYPYSAARRLDSGATKGALARIALKRGLLLIFLGLVYQNFFAFDFAHLRWWSVLGRIGIAWMVAVWLYLAVGRRSRLVLAVALLVGTALFFRFVPAPDAVAGVDLFSPEGNFGCWLDRTLTKGHIYQPLFDPEGFAGILPSIVTAMLGMFAGEWVRREDMTGNRKTVGLIAAAAVCALAAAALATFCPINKALWSSSFAMAVGAYSFLMFAIFYWIVDVRGWKDWTLFFRVIGMNSIAIYMAQRFLGFDKTVGFFFGGTINLLPANWHAAGDRVAYVVVCWLFLLILYRNKVFFKV